MIDVENLLINTISTAIRNDLTFANTNITSDYTDMPSSFPCVSIVEADNSSYRKTQDNDLKDHHVNVMYEVNVYSNKSSGAKSEAKKLMNIVDTAFLNLKFTRTFKNSVPNKDKTIYRYVARYEAVIGEQQTIGKDKVYQVYRK